MKKEKEVDKKWDNEAPASKTNEFPFNTWFLWYPLYSIDDNGLWHIGGVSEVKPKNNKHYD